MFVSHCTFNGEYKGENALTDELVGSRNGIWKDVNWMLMRIFTKIIKFLHRKSSFVDPWADSFNFSRKFVPRNTRPRGGTLTSETFHINQSATQCCSLTLHSSTWFVVVNFFATNIIDSQLETRDMMKISTSDYTVCLPG